MNDKHKKALYRGISVLQSLTMVLVAGAGVGALAHGVGWPTPWIANLTASMPRGIWVLEESEGEELVAGEVVTITPPTLARELGCVRPGQVLLKHVVGVPGDRVCVRQGDIYIKESSQPIARTRTRPQGEPGPRPIQGCEVVSPGHIWVATPHERSCDSRYFGQVPLASVSALARPVLTWETGLEATPNFPLHATHDPEDTP